MTWIQTTPPEDADESLETQYRRVTSSSGQVDQVLQAHSLRPHTLEGHMALYKAVLHHRNNTLPRWILEALGVLVSHLNGCTYCVDHHSENLRQLVEDDGAFYTLMDALVNNEWRDSFDAREQALLSYARALTLSPDRISRVVIDDMHETGLSDGEILEANQVVSYFCYVNRVVLGLGVHTDGEELGFSPTGDDADDWGHS